MAGPLPENFGCSHMVDIERHIIDVAAGTTQILRTGVAGQCIMVYEWRVSAAATGTFEWLEDVASLTKPMPIIAGAAHGGGGGKLATLRCADGKDLKLTAVTGRITGYAITYMAN